MNVDITHFMDADNLAQAAGLLASFAVLRNRVNRLEKDVDELSKTSVSNELFRATIEPLETALAELRSDIKELLKRTSEK